MQYRKRQAVAAVHVVGLQLGQQQAIAQVWPFLRARRPVLVDWLHVSEVWVGANFLFGRDRAGNFSMLRTLGASAVGMSTVYEAIAASHGKAEVVGISCITNLAAGISATKLSHDEVKETASMVEQAFAKLVMGLIGRLG